VARSRPWQASSATRRISPEVAPQALKTLGRCRIGSPIHVQLSSIRDSNYGKVVSAIDAVRLIHAGDTIATGGFVGIGFAEGIAVALEEFYLFGAQSDGGASGALRNLTLVYAAGQATER